MIQIKKTILTLVALLAVTTGAWADDPNTVVWNNETWAGWAENVTTHTVGDITITCSGNAKAYESTSSGEPLALQADASSAITFTSNGKPFASVSIALDDEYYVEGWTYNSYTLKWSGEPTTSVTLSGCDIKADEIRFTFGTAAPAGTVLTPDATRKLWTLEKMPAGNVELEPEYYPQATLTAAPTAADGAKATTDDLLVSGGTVATITGSNPAAPQGTLMYYVSLTNMSTEALLALDADDWVAEPTAAGITQKCGAYVYYYVKGNDSTDDALNFSDGDISKDNVLQVAIYPAPTYAVTFADGTDPNEWTASPNADVTKGQTVTVTYTGSKKVLGVKAEKKAKTAAVPEYYDKLTKINDSGFDQLSLLKNLGRGKTPYNSSLTAAQAYALATYQAAIDGKPVYVIMSSQDEGYSIHYALSTDAAATEHTADVYNIVNDSNPVRMYYVAQ